MTTSMDGSLKAALKQQWNLSCIAHPNKLFAPSRCAPKRNGLSRGTLRPSVAHGAKGGLGCTREPILRADDSRHDPSMV
jgi:hypothetical protein